MKIRIGLAFMVAALTVLCSCASGGQGQVTQVRRSQVIQNWNALREGMTYEEVNKLVGPLSKMRFFGDAHFDMTGVIDSTNVHYVDDACELVFHNKMKGNEKILSSKLISWTRR